MAAILEIFKPSSSKTEGLANAQTRPPVLSSGTFQGDNDVAEKKIEKPWQGTRDTCHFPGVLRASAALTGNVVGAMTLCHRKCEVPSAGYRVRQAATAAAPAWDSGANPETDEKHKVNL